VKRAGGDVDGYRRRMFHAWHETEARLGTADIIGVAADAGLDRERLDLAAGIAVVGRQHQAGERLGVFGSPTLLFGPRAAVFVKLAEVPAEAHRADELFACARAFAEQHTEALEFKRP
jgi:hypothetical protein